MKKAILLVFAFAVCSCAQSIGTTHPDPGVPRQPIIAWDTMNRPDPCQDSLFLALQNKPYAQMTAFEHSYFQQFWDECNGTPAVSHGNTAEWILATIAIVSVVASFIVAATH